MKIINNITEKLIDNIKTDVNPHCRISIAASCFSVYAYEALKAELEKVDFLRFIFTSPTFLPQPEERSVQQKPMASKIRTTIQEVRGENLTLKVPLKRQKKHLLLLTLIQEKNIQTHGLFQKSHWKE